MHAYGYTEETERFPIGYEVFFLPIRFSVRQKRNCLLLEKVITWFFNDNIREQKVFGLEMKIQENAPAVSA
jgi:hypothetical protein